MIKLTTPVKYAINNEIYTHAKILSQTTEVQIQRIVIRAAYGYLDSKGQFVKGRYPLQDFEVINQYAPDKDNMPVLVSANFDELTSSITKKGETIYEASSRILQEWLINKGHYPGTIV